MTRPHMSLEDLLEDILFSTHEAAARDEACPACGAEPVTEGKVTVTSHILPCRYLRWVTLTTFEDTGERPIFFDEHTQGEAQ